MLARLVKRIPNDWLVYLYKHMPFLKLKNWVVYKLQDKFLVAVLGIVTNEAGQVLLLRHVYRDEPWGLPGGWMEREQPAVAMGRELFEETKLSIKNSRIAQAIYGSKPERVELIYFAELSEGVFEPSAEISEYLFCDVGDWPVGMPERQKLLITELLKR